MGEMHLKNTKLTIYNSMIHSILTFGADRYMSKKCNINSTEIDFKMRTTKVTWMHRKTNLLFSEIIAVLKFIIQLSYVKTYMFSVLSDDAKFFASNLHDILNWNAIIVLNNCSCPTTNVLSKILDHSLVVRLMLFW